MNLEIFVVEMTKALAWPASIVVLALVFRSQLRKLLERLEHIKGGGVEANFREKLARVTESLPPEVEQHTDVAEAARANVKPGAPPGYVIFDAWNGLEERLKNFAAVNGLGDGRGKFREPLTIASKLGLSSGTLTTIKRLRSLRNDVVHASGSPPTLDDALEYVGLVAEVMQSLP